jgi:predicted nucleic acid-binding protein/Arc/MetJ family transcription regulator
VRTNIVLDDELVEEAFELANVKTKRELVDLALREFVANRRRRDIREPSRIRSQEAARRRLALYLVDTSAWIDYLEGRETEVAGRLGEVLDLGSPFGIAGVIYQEVLQGVSSQREFDDLTEYLGYQRFYHPGDTVESYREAAYLYFRCRREGVTVRSAIDCLIARIAIEHDLLLLHSDRDFERMVEVVPELKLA